MTLEQKLHKLIKETFQEIKDMKPEDGFSSPRDIDLVTEVNKKSAILNHIQDAMRVINPEYDIIEK
jgi:hypothetical protein